MPDHASAVAELSTLLARLEELSKRVTDLAERYRSTPDTRIASHLFAAERALHTARRAMDRATGELKS